MSATVKVSNETGSDDVIKGRVDFVLVFSAENANPNGDPGYDNRPRTDAYTGTGYVTDVCLKRKIRNRVEAMKELSDGYDIWVRSGTYLRETISNVLDGLRKTAEYKELTTDKEKESLEKRHLCSGFFDIRAFGGVLTSDSESSEEGEEPASGKGAKKDKGGKPKSKVGQIRGPVSIQYANSIAPIVVEDDEITRVCPTKFDPKKPDKKTEMGRKKRVPFAVYVAKGSISARLAEGERGTGFANADLQVLKNALRTLFVGDESTARPAGSMIVQKLVFFTHNSKDGDEPIHKTLCRVKVNLKPEFVDKPQSARSMEDYDNIEVNKEGFSGDVDELDAFKCNFMG
jgi:CRISPR-associated protein Csd2